ncbi:MAG: hypothetical protein PHZ19_07680 [Candidatus Thermoplasmatota archaeon]|nr:hypothetical protein [Candidatus Thermoplasmatota archaeon]
MMSSRNSSVSLKLLASLTLAAAILLTVTLLVAEALEDVIFFSLFVGIPVGIAAALVAFAAVWLGWPGQV